ncbi:Homologous-pairing protein 2 [Astathelohania contejeani]|uniref:Homologous-pairing protein 2 n=1 Tax=Astathelohania contejeani TaxID=164912 RepID=A0ABQ7HZ78_9MICR|nr:Homologous-pairing protein 2 [Thelohania contejeani]
MSEEKKEEVYKYIAYANRPFILSELVLVFKKSVPKAQLLKLLEELATEDKIIMKTYKKSVLCVAKQTEEIEDEGNEINIDEIKKENLLLKEEIKQKTNILQSLREYPSNDRLEIDIENYERELTALENKLADLKKGKSIPVKEMNKASSELAKLKTVYKNRKEIFRNVFDTLREGLAISKEEFIEQTGLEI